MTSERTGSNGLEVGMAESSPALTLGSGMRIAINSTGGCSTCTGHGASGATELTLLYGLMRYHLLAVDYDGTIAHDGQVDESTIAALQRLRDSGRQLVLVTGRRLEPLLEIFPRIDLFDRVVAENGALLYCPDDRTESILATPPPEEFAALLRERGVNRLEVGRAILATWHPHEAVALEAIRDYGIDLQIIFNKDAVMLLPSGVNKASGLKKALQQLGLSPINVVAVGDAENDEAMMRLCGASAAVDNALPRVKEMADLVLSQPRGAGVAELIEMILEDDLHRLQEQPKRGLPIGCTLSGDAFTIAESGESMFVTGGPGGGKSKFALSVLEKLIERGQQCCVVDPEGDYQLLEGTIVLGTADRAPEVEEVVKVLENPEDNCVVSFFSVEKSERPKYFDRLRRAVAELRSRTGHPHWILVDEAHYALPRGWHPANSWNRNELDGVMFITAYYDQFSEAVLKHVDWVISIAEDPREAIAQCSAMMGATLPDFSPPSDSGAHRALAWKRGTSEPIWFSRHVPTSERQRHQHSYYEGELAPEFRFIFRGPENRLALEVGNLKEFIKLMEGIDDETWNYHLKRHDYSTWVRGAFKDDELGDELEAYEANPPESLTDMKKRITDFIVQRYR